MTAAAVEREVKLAAWAGMALPDLEGVLPGFSVTPLLSQRLLATYYDTADLRLARWGVTVRHRSGETPGGANAGPESPWTVKLPADGSPEGGLARSEVTFSGAEGRVPAPVVQLVRGLARSAALGPVARLRTDRLRLELRDGDGTAVAEIDDDEVSVLVGRRLATRFREIEVELAGDSGPEVLAAVVARLRAAGAGAPDPTPKLIRALGPRALEPPDVAVHRVGEGATVGDVVKAAIGAAAVRLIRHDPGVRLGDDAEDVHQARVATRRLRSDLRTFHDFLDEEWAGELRTELGWVAALLGEVRDADVLLERLRAQSATLADADAKPAAGLLRRLEDQRELGRQALLVAIDSPRYTRLLDALVDAAANPVFAGPAERPPALDASAGADEPPPEPATSPREAPEDQPAAAALPGLVRRPWRHLQRAVADLGADPADAALHEVRIRAKRCRYAAEAAAPAVGKPATRFAVAVAELQGVLGDFHDAIVAEDWLRQAAARGSAAQALVAGQLIAVERADAAVGRIAWKPAWKEASAKKLRAWLDSP